MECSGGGGGPSRHLSVARAVLRPPLPSSTTGWGPPWPLVSARQPLPKTPAHGATCWVHVDKAKALGCDDSLAMLLPPTLRENRPPRASCFPPIGVDRRDRGS